MVSRPHDPHPRPAPPSSSKGEADLVAALDARMEAITAWVGARTVPLFLIRDGASPDLLGSAILVEMGGEHLLLTAAHVATHPDTAPGMGLATPGAADGDAMLVIEQTRVIFSDPGPSGTHDDDPVDVAWLTLPDDHAGKLRSRFRAIHVHDMAPADALGDDAMVVTYGFPSVRTQRVADGGLSTGGAAHLSRAISNAPTEAERFDARTQLLVQAHGRGVTRGGRRIESPAPHGMSGGGMWRIGDTTDGSWLKPSQPITLVGTQHAWRRNAYMRGSRIRMALALLYRHHPRIRPVLHLVR